MRNVLGLLLAVVFFGLMSWKDSSGISMEATGSGYLGNHSGGSQIEGNREGITTPVQRVTGKPGLQLADEGLRDKPLSRKEKIFVGIFILGAGVIFLQMAVRVLETVKKR